MNDHVRILMPDGTPVFIDSQNGAGIQSALDQGGTLEMDGASPRLYTYNEVVEYGRAQQSGESPRISGPPPQTAPPSGPVQTPLEQKVSPPQVAPPEVYSGQGMGGQEGANMAAQRAARRANPELTAAAFPDHTIPQPGDYNVAAGDSGPTDDPFNPNYNDRTGETGGWDLGYNPFEGTWAEGEGQSVYNQIGAGQMTPDYAVHRMLGAQGLGSHGQQGYLEEMYELYPEYYKMLNPGANPLMPHEEYGIGGDYVNQLMEPSDGYAVLDPRLMWDNTFAGANDPRYEADAMASDQPWVDQHQMVRQRIGALIPIIGEDNARGLLNQTDLLWRQYQDMQNSGQARPDYSFIDFMRDNGAGDWF